MKVGQLSDSRVAGGSTGLSKPGQGTSSTSATGSSSPSNVKEGVPVTVSPLAQAAHSASAGDVDVAKVESVRTAIANGTYKVNADAIADKLLSNAKEILKRQQQ